VGSWGDGFETCEGPDILEVANLFLDEPELKAVAFVDVDVDETIEVEKKPHM